MSDESAPTAAPNADLEELERRMASFESATKRLGRSVNDISDPTPAGHSSPPRPATRRLSESMAPRGEEISGLRPAVQSQGPQTGALTARARSPGNDTSSPPAFTSKFGRPALAPPPPPPAAPPSPPPRLLRATRLPLAILCVLVIGAYLLVIYSKASFPIIPEARVYAPTVNVAARIDGNVSQVMVKVGTIVHQGQPLLDIANNLYSTDTLDALRRERNAYPERAEKLDVSIAAEVARISRLSSDTLVAPGDGEVVSLPVNPGSRVIPGQTIVKIAPPGAERVTASIPDGRYVEVGWRVELRSTDSGQVSGGMISSILETGQDDDVGDIRTRRIVVTPDPSTARPKQGTAVSVLIIGPTLSPVRLALLAVRKLLP